MNSGFFAQCKDDLIFMESVTAGKAFDQTLSKYDLTGSPRELLTLCII